MSSFDNRCPGVPLCNDWRNLGESVAFIRFLTEFQTVERQLIENATPCRLQLQETSLKLSTKSVLY